MLQEQRCDALRGEQRDNDGHISEEENYKRTVGRCLGHHLENLIGSCSSMTSSSLHPKTGIISDTSTMVATPTETQNAPAARSGQYSSAARRKSQPAASEPNRPIYMRQRSGR